MIEGPDQLMDCTSIYFSKTGCIPSSLGESKRSRFWTVKLNGVWMHCATVCFAANVKFGNQFRRAAARCLARPALAAGRWGSGWPGSRPACWCGSVFECETAAHLGAAGTSSRGAVEKCALTVLWMGEEVGGGRFG